MSEKLFPSNLLPFADVFPEIEKLAISVKILNSGGNEVNEKVYSNTNFPTSGVSCGNNVCKNGGLSANAIAAAIKGMYLKKETDYSDYIDCHGGRFSGKKLYDSCGWSFKLIFKIQYKL